MKIEGFTTKQIQSLIHAQDSKLDNDPPRVSAQYIGAEAKRQGWGYQEVGRAKVYDTDDVWDWLTIRLRSKLQRIMGGSDGSVGQQSFVNDMYDFECHICGGFAVPKWPENIEAGIEWLQSSDPNRHIWMCENGHGHGNE